MKNPVEFKKAIGTLLHSWGSETPPEVIWGLNELVDWAETEFGVTIDKRFDDPFEEDAIDPSIVIDEITSKL